jgi:hypothetical protein
MKSWTQPTSEMIEKVLASVKKETDRQYFFSRLKNPLWIQPLRERGYFGTPPGAKHLPDGYVQFPHWQELSYLVTVASEAPDAIIDILLALPKTDNPRVYDDILSIALQLEGGKSAKLLPKLVEYAELDIQLLSHRYPDLLQHWAKQGRCEEALEIFKRLVPFREDPRAQEKSALHKKNPTTYGSSLEPVPQFNLWEYQEILQRGITPLVDIEPHRVALILIEAVDSMIRLGIHLDDLQKMRDEDYSEIWCRRLDARESDYQDARAILVQALTHACTNVYVKVPGSIFELDQALRRPQWKVFKRLRQLIYASHPSEQTLPWIRELIISHDDYSRWEYHYEFQLMLRKACEHFGSTLLTDAEQFAIFDAIRSGPSIDDFRDWMGDKFTEAAFQQRQHHFHRLQLRPFAALLSGDIKRYYKQLVGEAQEEGVTDDSYSPYGETTSGMVVYRSPKSAEELERFSDSELLNYLNVWNEGQRDKDNWLVEINSSALALVFQSFFKDRIASDGERLSFWMANRNEIARPIYVASMVKAMLDLVKEKNSSGLEQWIEFCMWVLSHPGSQRVEGQPVPRDDSPDYPDWDGARRSVVDFIDICVGDKEAGAPINARDGLGKLLQLVCSQKDRRLDQGLQILLNRDDPISEAINNTRSRALVSLVNFGFWIRRHLPSDPLLDVTGILQRRTAMDAKPPLTRPERALLGMHFGNLSGLNRAWAVEHLEILFPQGDAPAWRDSFGSYLRFNRPDKATFEALRGEFEYALEHIDLFGDGQDDSKEIVNRLGQHLFSNYLWQAFPLIGEGALLARFYEKTGYDHKIWGRLFEHVGRIFSNSGAHLDKSLTDRAVAYFDWRLAAKERLELQHFTFWLQAECLDSEWRLSSYSKVLDLGCEQDVNRYSEVRSLNKLLPAHLPLVVECFRKITETFKGSPSFYIPVDDAKPILAAGLIADDAQVRRNAEGARENLLQSGRFEFLDLEAT